MKAHGFRYYFTPLFEVLFTFPSRYSYAIGLSVVFSLAGWAPQIHAEFLVLRATQVSDCRQFRHFAYGTLTLYGAAFQQLPLCLNVRAPLILQPRIRLPEATAAVWATPRSLATTCGIILIFSSCGYLDVSVPHVRPDGHLAASAGIASGGFPHSDICGSAGICPSPQLFAACHVLRRLREPQASPVRPCSLSLFLSPCRKPCSPHHAAPTSPCLAAWTGTRARERSICSQLLSSLCGITRTAVGITAGNPVTCLIRRGRAARSFFQHVNDLFPFLFLSVVPGRLELPTSTLSV